MKKNSKKEKEQEAPKHLQKSPQEQLEHAKEYGKLNKLQKHHYQELLVKGHEKDAALEGAKAFGAEK